MLGTFFGFAVNTFFPEWTAESGAYALVAMGGVVGATTHGPITAILIIFELTNDYKIILPLMITTIIATLISVRFQKESIYTLKLVRKGINIFAGRELNVLRSLKVESVVKKSINLVPEDMPFSRLLEKIVNSHHNYTYVIDENKKITGCISMAEIRQTITDYDTLKHLLIAKDIAHHNVTMIRESDNLDFAMKEFSRSGHDELPVIRNGRKNEVVGTIAQIDVINTYNHQIFLRDMSGELGSSMQKVEETKSVHVVENYYFHEIEAPSPFIGKSLAELNIRNNYSLEAVLIKRQKVKEGKLEDRYIQPKANTVLRLNDKLLIFGNQKNFKQFKNAKE
jgi:CIC family chloride channel protein